MYPAFARFPRCARRPSWVVRLVAIGMLLPSLAGCSSTSKLRNSPPVSQITGGVCDNVDALSHLLSDFLSSYNAGQPQLVDRFFAPVPAFRWYSEPPMRLGEAAYARDTLEGYLARRHAEGDHLTLVSVKLSGTRLGVGNFGFVVRRSATELSSKGAVQCADHLFVVWSLGPNPGP